ncbi:MAG: peptidoglycan DD-metalloendopeptidase family protein, partial [Clostridia bacterium]|nr:peptidoglycan DD-metalloendopeptidase family protein [Clostridia bacterium]
DGRGILKIEIIDQQVWVTYSDAPDAPVNVGSVVEQVAGTQGLDYYLLQDGTYGVEMGKAKYLGSIEIPSTYNGKPVTQILPYGFAGCYAQTVVIPSSITTICNNAFDGAKLTSVTIPSSVVNVGDNAFTDKTADLKEIVVLSSYTNVSNWGNWNTSLAVVTIDGLYLHPLALGGEVLNAYSQDHTGVDVAGKVGDAVVASFAGKVTEITDDILLGTYIVVESSTARAIYSFITPVETLSVGDTVGYGQKLATIAEATGVEYKLGEHLHFELYVNGEAVNPADYVTFEIGQFVSPIKNGVVALTHGQFYQNQVTNSYSDHNGVCIAANLAENVYAAFGGTIVDIYDNGYSEEESIICVAIQWGDYYATYVGIDLDDSLEIGSTVAAGQLIGCVADCHYEFSDGYYLHFTIQVDGNQVDPAEYIDF